MTTARSSEPRPRTHLFAAIGSVAIALAIGAVGGLFTASSVAGLRKPAFNPPNAVFGPVWTALYVLMALAAWRVWRATRAGGRSGLPLTLYALQLGLNLAWSLLFFGPAGPTWPSSTSSSYWRRSSLPPSGGLTPRRPDHGPVRRLGDVRPGAQLRDLAAELALRSIGSGADSPTPSALRRPPIPGRPTTQHVRHFRDRRRRRRQGLQEESCRAHPDPRRIHHHILRYAHRRFPDKVRPRPAAKPRGPVDDGEIGWREPHRQKGDPCARPFCGAGFDS
jgi:hypothetical protein